MSLSARINRLERLARRVKPAAEPAADLDEVGWLARWEAWGRASGFAREPDFPEVLAYYRDALTRARAQPDPPFDPPPEFQPYLADRPVLRGRNWRTRSRFPEVSDGFSWLLGMTIRVQRGLAPVTKAEFDELGDWINDNKDLLYRQSLPSQLLDLGDGRRDSVTNLLWRLGHGPWEPEASQLVEDLLRLRARTGTPVTGPPAG